MWVGAEILFVFLVGRLSIRWGPIPNIPPPEYASDTKHQTQIIFILRLVCHVDFSMTEDKKTQLIFPGAVVVQALN